MFTKATLVPFAIGMVAGVLFAAPIRRMLGMASMPVETGNSPRMGVAPTPAPN